MAPFERQGLDLARGDDEPLPTPLLPRHATRDAAVPLVPPPQAPTRRPGGGPRAVALAILPWASALLSIAVFGVFLRSWQFGLGIVALLYVHEMGHFIVFWLKGVRARLPIFIPLFGAFVMPLDVVASAQDFAMVALAGPVVGGVGALVCLLVAQSIAVSSCQVSLFTEPTSVGTLYCLAEQGHAAFYWLGLATFGFFINLLNLIPVNPLDGGRVVGAISRWIWPLALVASIALAGFDVLHYHHLSIVWLTVVLAAIFGFGETVWRFRQAPKSTYYATPLAARVGITLAYVAASVLLTYGMMLSAQMFDVGRFIW